MSLQNRFSRRSLSVLALVVVPVLKLLLCSFLCRTDDQYSGEQEPCWCAYGMNVAAPLCSACTMSGVSDRTNTKHAVEMYHTIMPVMPHEHAADGMLLLT